MHKVEANWPAMAYLAALPGIQARVHTERGAEQALTEIYLIGNTQQLEVEDMQSLPCVERVVRVSEEYRILGRHKDDPRPSHFEYNGVRFGQDTLHVFAGLCAVDNPEHVGQMMKAVSEQGQVCTRMGAYKPRTNPYSFQGHGKNCLPWVFEAAGKHGIKLIAMEATDASHLDEISQALESAGSPTGVMVQAGGSVDHVVTQYIYPGGPLVYAEGSWLLAKGFNMKNKPVLRIRSVSY